MDLFSETKTLFDQDSQRLEQLNAIINAVAPSLRSWSGERI
jgi:hypothetical protein